MKTIVTFIVAVFMVSCVEIPEGVKPVQNFNLDRYLGTWYEIARLNHRFEVGFKSVSVEYSRNDNGSIAVKNRGYIVRRREWRDAEAKASFVGDPTVGHLKVSYIPLLYDSYLIFGLDEEYQHAFVCGDDTDHLWLLARTKVVDEEVIDDFVNKAQGLGFDTDELIFVQQF